MADDDLQPASLDSEAWYHLTEGRVDTDWSYDAPLNNTLTENDNGTLLASIAGDAPVLWQFMPIGDDAPAGRYQVRSTDHNLERQLAVCYVQGEIDDHHTRPCMARSDGSPRQEWDVADWGDGTFRFINVRNGSDYVMDVHRGNPAYMGAPNSDIPSQHWLMTSSRTIGDASFQTVFRGADTSETPTGGPSADDDGGGGLSTGAAAGIGVGVALAVIFLAVGGFLLWRRRRARTAAAAAQGAELPSGGYEAVNKSPLAPPSQSDWTASPPPPLLAQDLVVGTAQEMSADSAPQELSSNTSGARHAQHSYAELEAYPSNR